MADEITNKQEEKATKEEKKTLDDDVKFSWWRVMKNGVKNMKEDVDPVYKGAKIGAYALHGIPTWHREYNDGRLANDNNGWSAAAATFVMATEGAAYFVGTKEAVAQYGPAGYAVLAVPLTFQAISYTREAFRKAKKSEMGNVIQNRIQRRINNSDNKEYDLSLSDMVTACSSEITKRASTGKENVDDSWSRARYHTSSERKASDNPEIQAYSTIGETAEHVYNQLFAFDQVGSQYCLFRDFSMVNKSNEKKRKEEGSHDYVGEKPEGFLQNLIWDTVAKNNGSANIELLGKVTAIYKGQGAAREVHYQVEPNELWKR